MTAVDVAITTVEVAVSPASFSVVEVSPQGQVLVDVAIPAAPVVAVAMPGAPAVDVVFLGPPGPSAYGVAVANGFSGTEAVWLESLVGEEVSYTHNQGVPSTTWTINHNLGFRPVVAVTDSAGDECVGDIAHSNTNTLVVTFSSSFSGRARLT